MTSIILLSLVFVFVLNVNCVKKILYRFPLFVWANSIICVHITSEFVCFCVFLHSVHSFLQENIPVCDH